MLSGLAVAAATAGLAASRPNIVLVIGDDISPDFSCYGGPVQTPHIDALATEGMRFANAYVTASSCSPSRSSIITGRYPHNTGAPELHMPLPPGQFMFPAALREASYHAVLSGKFHLGDEAWPAFDVVDETNYYSEPTGAARWVEHLRERPRDRPFFMWFAAYDAHRPWEADPEAPPHDPANVTLPAGVPDTPLARQDVAGYYDEVRRFDRSVGRMIDELKAQHVLDETIIIVIADNGRPFPRSKTSLYDGGMKTPLIIRGPAAGLKPGAVSASLVSTIDLAPFILELAGCAVPPAVQGISLAPILRDPAAQTRRWIAGEQNWHVQRYAGRMVREGDFVYLRNFTPDLFPFQMVDQSFGTYAELLRMRESGQLTPEQAEAFATDAPPEALFDVRQDPDQLNNLVDEPRFAAVLAALRARLASWQERTGDSVPAAERMTPDRIDRQTFARTHPGLRPPTGGIPGERHGAAALVAPDAVAQDLEAASAGRSTGERSRPEIILERVKSP